MNDFPLGLAFVLHTIKEEEEITQTHRVREEPTALAIVRSITGARKSKGSIPPPSSRRAA